MYMYWSKYIVTHIYLLYTLILNTFAAFNKPRDGYKKL
jgi:hypothetical protein